MRRLIFTGLVVIVLCLNSNSATNMVNIETETEEQSTKDIAAYFTEFENGNITFEKFSKITENYDFHQSSSKNVVIIHDKHMIPSKE